MNLKIVRLKEHVDFLAELLGKGANSPSDYEGLIKEKFRLMKELKISYEKSSPEIIANKQGGEFPTRPFFRKIVSHYAHQDLTVETDPKQDFFYPSEGQTFFTNSGQSASNLALLFLFTNFPGVQIRTPHVLYHEARDYLHAMKKIAMREDGIKATYIDSTSFEVTPANIASHFKNAEWLVIDSTCWEMRSSEMQMILEHLKKWNVPAFIVRSHVKLDSLGAEYGLLGSLHFYAGTLSAGEIEKYRLAMKNLIAINRCAAGHVDLYPFWINGKFSDLTQARTKDIRMNTRTVGAYLMQKYPGQVTTYPHELFCTLELPHHPQIKEFLVKSSFVAKVPYLICDSFGFDQLSITYIDSRTDNSKCWLRVAGSDLSQEDLEDGIVTITKVVDKLFL